MTIAELRKRVAVSTIPRIEMSVTDVAALLDVAEAARECLGRSYIMVADRERLAAALAKLGSK